jgi:hypothetical protein
VAPSPEPEPSALLPEELAQQSLPKQCSANETKLANDAVTTTKILDGTITGSDIANTTITTDKLAASGAITDQVLQYNGTNWAPVTLAASGTVTNVTGTAPITVLNPTTTPAISIAAAGITNTLIADNAVNSVKIEDGTITGTDIAATTIATGNIADNAITTVKIQDATITGADIAATTIATGNIADNAITSAKIQDATITGADIANTTITTDKLAASGATTDQVLQYNGTNWAPVTLAASGTVTNVTGTAPITVLNPTTTPAISIAAAGITNTLIADNAVNSVKIEDGTITGADIAATTIATGNIADNAITSVKIQDGTITGVDIAATTIVTGNIADNAITSGKIADEEITNADIAGTAAIAVSKLAAGTDNQVLTTVAGVPTWAAGSAGWNLTGNAGTDPALNFVGTTDIQGLSFRTNNTERLLIAPNNNPGSNLFTMPAGAGREFYFPSGGDNIDFFAESQFNLESSTTIVMAAPSGVLLQPGGGNVGIGAVNPNAPLQFASSLANRKIVLFEAANNDHEYFGFGINSAELRYQTDKNSSHVFYTGIDAANSAELMRIRSDGHVGIGTSNPLAKFHVSGNGNTEWWKAAMYISQTGTGARTYSVSVRPGGNFQIGDEDANAERLVITPAGDIGIGTFAPEAKLDIVGSIKIADGTQAPGSVLTSDANGLASWQPASAGFNTINSIPRGDGTTLVASSIFDDGTNVGIGTVAVPSPLTIAGNTHISGNSSIGSGLIFPSTIDLSIDDNDTGFEVPADGVLSLFTNNQEQIRLTGGNVGIGTTTPAAKLDIIGNIKITDGTQAAGSVLTSDANGLASWQPAGGGSLQSAYNGGSTIEANNPTILLKSTQTGSFAAPQIQFGKDDGGGGFLQLGSVGVPGSSDDFEIFGTNRIFFNANFSTRMAIDGTGRVGIGTITPANILHVAGDVGGASTIATMEGHSTTATRGPGISLLRSKGTQESPLAIEDGDYLGGFSVSGRTASAYNLSSGIQFNVDGAVAGTSVPGRITFSTTLAGNSAPSERMRITNAGNVGIGTTTPAARLDIVGGPIKITDGTQAAGRVLTSDANGLASWTTPSGSVLINNPGTRNLFAGSPIGTTTTGTDNAFYGSGAGDSNAGGSWNVFMGSSAGTANTTGALNTLIGWRAGVAAATNNGNTFIGAQAGENTTQNVNTFIGEKAGQNNTTGSENVFMGNSAGDTNTTGGRNTIIGNNADVSAAGLQNATAIGYNAIVGASNSLVLGGTGANAVNVGIGTTSPSSRLDITGNTLLRGSNTNTAPTVNSALELMTGRAFGGALIAGQTSADIAFNWGGASGGFRHFMQTRHNSVANSNTNSIDFYVNNSTTAAGSLIPNNTVPNGNVLAMSMTAVGIGIGTATPNAQLQLAPTTANRKLVLYDISNNDHQFYGFGVQGGEFRYQIANNTGAAHRFFAATSATTSLLQMSIGQNGNVAIAGTLSKGSGTFKIDHPTDPENKFLFHSFVESPDMMNVYNGNVETDANGFATVELPGYFEALNREFRYQLTVLGQFAQAIVLKEIANNQFVIQTDKPGVKVSWQVTGVRKDPFAEKNRVVPEVDKSPEEKGKYLHPEAYGQPTQKRIGLENNFN